MFKTIKSKIIAITLGIFAIFSIVIFTLEFISYYHFKMLKIETCRNQVEKFSERLNDSIRQLDENAVSLGLAGAAFNYYNKNNKDFIDFIVKDNFKNNNELSVGGGIWFEPYVINPKKQRFCSYAYRKNNDNVVVDKNFEGKKYNYLEQKWYKHIKSKYNFNSKNDLIWTSPYFDESGTKKLMVTVGTAIYDRQGKFVGMATVDWLLNSIIKKLDSLRPTENSIVLFADKNNDFVIALSDNNPNTTNMVGESLKKVPWYDGMKKNEEYILFNSVKYISFKEVLKNDMILIVNVPENELFALQTFNILLGIFLRILFGIIFALMTYIVLTKNINKPIEILVQSAEKIGAGNLDKKIDIIKPLEFAQLADTFNKMTSDIQEYLNNINKMTYEKQRIDSELNIAREIQASILPKTFPPYFDRTEFNVDASMIAAKEVGGDFYDFYFVDEEHIAITIADVSGKGIPAAMFMMTAKTLIKNLAQRKLEPNELFEYANERLYQNNKKGFFVTAFFAIINLKTGYTKYINAGHNPPLIKRKMGKFEYMSVDSNIPLGIIEDFAYKSGELKLDKGDIIYLYTDGITEAVNDKQEFFGEDRLKNILDDKMLIKSKQIIEKVNAELKEYTKNCEQADDITMLAFKYTGLNNIYENIKIPAKISELKSLLNWVEALCIQCNIDDDKKTKILISAEEIFVNIAYYAYPDKSEEKNKDISVYFKFIKEINELSLIFLDSGIKYNPIERVYKVNTNISLEERQNGGFGIHMVKNMMNSLDYQYKNKHNILTLTLDI